MKTYGITVFNNDTGQIVLTQSRFGEGDVVILLAPDQIDILCAWLQQAKNVGCVLYGMVPTDGMEG